LYKGFHNTGGKMGSIPMEEAIENKTEDFFQKLWKESGRTETDLAILKHREENDFTLQLAELVGALGSRYPECTVSVGGYYQDPEPPIYEVFGISKVGTGTEEDLIANCCFSH